MIYIFDKTQAIIKVLTNDDFTAAHLNFKINTATTFEFSLPASKALPSGSKYVATPHPLNDSKFIMLRLTERVDNTETIDYSAYELAYQELATDGYIEDKRPHNQSALNLMKIALDGSNWELNNVNVSGTATTNFYYVDRLSAISKVVDLLGGEIVFYIEIQGNAISGRYMDYLARQGADTSKVFASGSNLLTVERQSDTSNIYTAILPRGKGEEIDNGEADTPDGYGRRINIADVEWKKSAGKPLDKPKGSIVLSDPDATAEWGQINGNARLLLKTYDDIDDVNVLINSAYKTLQSVNHPQIQYSATVADVGGLSLGDTVLIMHGDRDLSYKTRVFEVKYDLLSPDQTELSLGDDLSSNSITSQLNSLNAVADTTSSQTQWTINQIGRPGTTYGATAPNSPKVGDIWFKHLPDGGTEIYRWNGDIWELLASPTTNDDIAKAVDDAVSQAKSHIDEVKQGLSSDIATAKSQAASLANAAEANAKSEAVSQFNQAQRILSDAKKDLTESIASEASQAVAAANSQAQNYVNQAKSDINDTINALSVGGRNLLLGTANDVTGVGHNVINEPFGYYSLVGGKKVSDLYNQYGSSGYLTISFNWVASGSTISGTFIPQWIGTPWGGLSDSDIKVSSTNSSGHYEHTVTLSTDGYSTGWASAIRFRQDHLQGNITITNLKLESGNKATDWTPAPEDVVLDYTTKDNKIKETITQYQDTNDRYVRKAQTDATTALGLVETKVSQTDYDKKTGDLSTKVNEVKDTADKSLKTIADIQEADGKQDERMAEIEKTAGGIKSTVSDLSTAQEKQSGSISTLQQTAKGFEETVTKVNNLAVGGRNLLLGTSDWTDDTRWRQRWTVTKDVYRGMVIAATTQPWTSPHYMIQNAGILQVGKTYTFSTYVRNTSDTDTQVTGFYDWKIVEFGVNTIPLPAHTDWMRVSTTFKVIKDPITSGEALRWEGHDNLTNGFIQFAGYKLEEGNLPTDWSPAPEDVQSDIAQVKVTADGINKFVRDSSGNISSDFQTALSKTSIITDSTLASSIQKQTATQITSALTDNNKNIIAMINLDMSGVKIAGKNIVLDGDTTVTGDFYAKGGNFKNLNASNLTVGTLNGNQVNITNINANNIVSGAISGANLNINLNTGSVVFQKGRINSSDYTTDINIDQGYISTANDNTRALIKQGMIQLVAPNRFDLDSSPYMEISNNRGQSTAGAAIIGRDSVSIANSKNSKNIFPAPIGTETFSGLYTGQAFDGGWLPTKVAGADRGVVVAGGTETTWQVVNSSPYIRVGTDAGGSYSYGNRVVIKAEYLNADTVYYHGNSHGANVYVASDGALLKSSSATKYKTNIEHKTDSIQGDQLLTIDPATWNDKFEAEQLEHYHETGIEPERQINMEGKRYYGIIAEDLVKAGLEELVTRNEETDEVEGVEYSKIGVALIPIVRDLRNRLNEQYVEIERLKDKIK
ncbi:phage tail spike protein [Leuconostoc mesenteroides]|uniref:phage tail spike protein n=1 Tax=Leuconostoc mesenteroides TaxID=1245 RepID=UPI0023625827|nr:phage tail spike protein [Leuconostoc mesenteroides]